MSIIFANQQTVMTASETNGEPIMGEAIALGTNLVDNITGYQGAYVSTDNQLVQLGGTIQNTVALAVGATIIKLHDLMTPIENELTTIRVNGVNKVAEIDYLGNITIKEAIAINSLISLNDIKFISKEVYAPASEPDATEPIEPSDDMMVVDLVLMNGFTNYNETVFGKAQASWNGDGIVYLKGMLRAPVGTIAGNTVMAKIPVQATGIDGTNVFQQNTKGGSMRVDVKTVGASHADIIYSNTSGALVEWVSLSGINFDCGVRE